MFYPIYFFDLFFYSPVAQGIEQQPSKLWVIGSIPIRITKSNLEQNKLITFFKLKTIKQNYGKFRKSNRK